MDEQGSSFRINLSYASQTSAKAEGKAGSLPLSLEILGKVKYE